MQGYVSANLKSIIDEVGESAAKALLSNFTCPQNKDVENFLKHKAIEFAKQSIATTYLVFGSYKGNNVLIGYFTLANKFVAIYKEGLSSTYRRRISKFCQFDRDIKRYTLAAPLIAQLGKNFYNGYNELITGDELLKMACDKVKESQVIIGGKVVYLECEDKEKLTGFYASNGFVNFGKRKLDKDETDVMEGQY
jgi:hypothetical protein